MPFISGNVRTTIFVRPLAIVEHSFLSITGIEHGFMTVVHMCNFLHKAIGKKFASSNASQGPLANLWRKLYLCITIINPVQCRWPHKFGRANIPGDEVHHHNFAMSCILQNTFDADLEINHINPVEYQFKKYCRFLSDEIFWYANIEDIN